MILTEPDLFPQDLVKDSCSGQHTLSKFPHAAAYEFNLLDPHRGTAKDESTLYQHDVAHFESHDTNNYVHVKEGDVVDETNIEVIYDYSQEAKNEYEDAIKAMGQQPNDKVTGRIFLFVNGKLQCANECP